MRFITEFKVPESAQSNKRYIPDKRYLSELKMGNMLAESFGWENPVNHDLDYHRLEIEAFPMDKWVEFKQKLIENFADDISARSILSILIEQLESFGKPSGDAMPSNPPIQQTDVKYYYDNLDGRVYRQDSNGQVDDITNQQFNKL